VFRIFLLLLTAFVIGCTPSAEQPKTAVDKSEPVQEKADLTLAMIPTTDCLPFFIAQRNGIYDSLGLQLRLILYPSQMDAEMSVQKKQTDGCASDIFRTILLQNQKKEIKLLFATRREWDLVANRALRATKIPHISSRMIGMTRHSVIDYMCDFFKTQMNTAKGPMLCPQINSVFIRENMLDANQIDAAVMPRPQSLVAIWKGHTNLFSSGTKYDGFAGISIASDLLKDSSKVKKIKLLRKGYDLTVKKLLHAKSPLISNVLAKGFKMEIIADSIKPEHFAPSHDFKQDKVNDALQWLKGRNQLRQDYLTDTLLFKQ